MRKKDCDACTYGARTWLQLALLVWLICGAVVASTVSTAAAVETAAVIARAIISPSAARTITDLTFTVTALSVTGEFGLLALQARVIKRRLL